MRNNFSFESDIETFLDHLKHERAASTHTQIAYKKDLEQAAMFFVCAGFFSWQEIQNENFLNFQTFLIEQRYSRSTLQRKICSIKSLLKFLKRRGKHLKLDLIALTSSKKIMHLPKALSFEHLKKLLDAPDITSPTGLRDRALMELIYGTGLRISEAISLQISQIDLDTNSIVVVGKREKTRWLPIPALTHEWIQKYLEESRPKLAQKPQGQLILSNRGLTLLRQTAYSILQKYAKLAGLEASVSPHILRHTYSVHLLKGGADLRTVQELLGHESISTTQIYTQLELSEIAKRYHSAHPRR